MLTIVPNIGVTISGIQSLETAKVAIKNRAGIAFVFDQKSSKYIDPLKASKISEVLSKDVSTVGIFTDPLLMILAVTKFVIVVGWFMHLRFENKLINRFFTGGMILALFLFSIVMIERASANLF